MSEQARIILEQSWRQSTKSKYLVYLNKGRPYCGTNDENWLEPNVQSCVNLLADLHQDGLQYSGVNLARSALSAVVVIRGWGPVGGHPLVKRLLRGVFLRTPPKPRYDGIWDVNIMFNFLRGNPTVGNLCLEDLSLFTVTLLLILSAERCQTLAKLTLEGVKLEGDNVVLKVEGLLKTSRPGHHKSELVLKAYPEDVKLCIKSFLREYIHRTARLRKPNSDGWHSLVVGLVPPHKPVGSATIGRWTKTTLKRAGVDTGQFGAHSTRAAATSAARSIIPVDQLVKKVGWASEKIFAVFYDKPIRDTGGVGEALMTRLAPTES